MQVQRMVKVFQLKNTMKLGSTLSCSLNEENHLHNIRPQLIEPLHNYA